ncbi:unnamed protein product [Cylindrotheca closterium]|uniref:Uncharacterized protein n=1 Tax=Cylindrotheca closterium TaxID=2856 RepID=A0AAD2FFC3_9STRA|nr:unnamed protein product [Cylindrotheca closterium]
MNKNESAQEATDNLAALIQDAKDFNTRPNVPVGNVNTQIGDDDVSAISFQSSRSIKDKIRIVQDSSASEAQIAQPADVKGGENNNKNLDELRQTVEDWKSSSKKQWKGIQDSTNAAIGTVKSKSQEIIDDKIKPGWKKIEGASKGLVDTKLKPLWEQSSGVARGVPGQTKAVILNVRDSSIQHYETHLSPKLGVFRAFHEKNSKYYLGKAPGVFETRDMTDMKYQLLEQVVLSIGMVLQCENPTSGIIIFLGLLIGSPGVAISALLSLVAALLFRRVYIPLIESKMWPIRAGANAFLAGAFMASLTGISNSNLILGILGKVIFCSILGPTCLFVHCQLFPPSSSTPPLLWSFNLLVAVMLLGLGLRYPEILTPLASSTSGDDDAEYLESFSIFSSTLCGISGIFAISNVWSGVFILFGVSLCSRLFLAYLLLATSITSLLAAAVGMETVNVNAGLAGSQAALTAVTCAYYFEPSKHLLLVGTLTLIWTCILEAAVATVFYRLTGQAITLTIGFCMAIFPLLLERADIENFGLHRIPEEDLSFPEVYNVPIKLDMDEDDFDLVLDVVDENGDEEGSNFATENTPLLV